MTMLVIRREQMAALGQERFLAKLVRFARDYHGADVAHLSDSDLAGRIEAAVARGRALGLTWELTLLRYVRLTISGSSAFFDHPALSPALERIRAADDPDLAFFQLETLAGPAAWDSAHGRETAQLPAENND
jgi:hypothetical protein